jgi:hypothetical protein
MQNYSLFMQVEVSNHFIVKQMEVGVRG